MSRRLLAAAACLPGLLLAPPAHAGNGGSAPMPPPTASAPTPPASAVLRGDLAVAPRGAPAAVRRVIAAGNAIRTRPYRYGGGHRSFTDTAYDCSGAVSFALHGGNLLASPLPSTALMTWGARGHGRWITVYANAGHAYLVVAGLRLDTSGTGGTGPRWHADARSPQGFTARHPQGL